MANAFAIVVAVIGPLIIIAVNIYVLIHFAHPDDRNVAWFPKLVVLIGFTMAEAAVLMLPLDVANGPNGLLPMNELWLAVQIIIGILVIFVCPFAIFYYESEEEDGNVFTQLKGAIINMIIVLIITCIVVGLMYGLIGYVEFPVQRATTLLDPVWETSYVECPRLAERSQCTSDGIQVDFRVSFPVYVIGLIAFVGWFLFVLFASFGMFAIPMDAINNYRRRPKRISLDQYANQKLTMHSRAEKLYDMGMKLKSDPSFKPRGSANDKRTLNAYRQAVMILEEDWKFLKKAYRVINSNPLAPYISLVAGIIGMVVAVFWLIHILLYLFLQPPLAGFLNEYFISLDRVFPLFGTITYGIFAFYLLWATIKGNMAFGLNFIFFSIHPMKVGGTMMNAFLFNTLLICLCSVSVVQFCTQAFADYVQGTAANLLFTNQITYLKYISVFWRKTLFIYAFFIMSIVTIGFKFLCPGRKKKDADWVMKQMEKRHKTSGVN